MDLSRREALNRLTLLVGGALSAPVMSAILSGYRAAPPAPGWVPRTLTARQAELLDLLVDVIIPPTDTPGAKDAGVPAFIDKLLADWVDPEDRESFRTGLAGVDDACRQAHGVSFRDATPAQRHAFVTQLDEEAIQARGGGPPPFFATLKEWTLVGYYTSEVGATQELQWLAAPGRYDGDVPLSEVGRAWA
jgi:hypothetical protein